MKGHVLRYLTFFLIGLADSYVVAWMFVILSLMLGYPHITDEGDFHVTFSKGSTETFHYKPSFGSVIVYDINADYQFPYSKLRQYGDVVQIEPRKRAPLAATRTLHALLDPARDSNSMMFSAGWPFPCCMVTDSSQPNGKNSITGAIFINVGFGSFWLPYLPLTKYLLFNSLIYGFLSFIVLKGTRSTVRQLRISHGWCPKCKYDLRGDFATGCPECGWNRIEKNRYGNRE